MEPSAGVLYLWQYPIPMNPISPNSSRRLALKQIGLASAALLAAPSIACATTAPPDKVLGVALVGLGRYSTVMLGPALKETTRCKLTAIVTGTPEKAEKWSKEYNIPQKNIYNYDTFDQIADNPDIDIVYIVLPNFMHAEYSIRAAKAGKHVICEKPMAMNSRECEDMIIACKEADRLLSIGYRLHYEAHHLEVIRMREAQEFGPINFIEASMGYHMADPKIWRLDKAKGGGGAIMDLGVYCIQAARYASGEEPIRVLAKGIVRNSEKFKDIYETLTWTLEFPSGVIANSTTSYSSYVDRLYVSGEQGWIRLHPSFNGRGSLGETHIGKLDLPKHNQQALHMDDFATSILENKPVKVPGEEGLQDLEIVEAIVRSADTGASVSLV